MQFVVAFGPGSSTDIVGRLMAQKLTEVLGQTFVVENRPGAGGNIAAQLVKRAQPDGYTVLIISVAYTVNPSLYANPGYDPMKDFVPVALGPTTPNLITVNPSVPVKNLQELVDLARKQPLAYASSGIGTTTQLGQLGFESRRNSPAEFAAFVREEIPKWAKAVKDSGAKVD